MSSDIAVALPPNAKYGERTLELLNRTQRDRIPIAGGIELTHRCNLACVHCYVNLPANDRGAQQRELTTEQVFKVLDQLAEAGVLYLTITGGEPLLRPDFVAIYTYAHELGLVLTVYTNGCLITDKIIALWQDRPPRDIEITQYGFSEETYDRVADAGEGQYQRFVRGLTKLREAGIAISMKTVAMRSNQHEVELMRRAAEDAGLPFRFDAIISPRIDGGKGPLRERLTPDEVNALELGDEQRQKEYAGYCKSVVGTPENDSLYQCGAGLAHFLIDPYGKMHVCELSRRPGWDVLEKGFLEIWNYAFPAERERKREALGGCGSCGAFGVCSNCVGMAQLESGDLVWGNTYFCEISDKRNEAVLGDERARPNGLVRLRVPEAARSR